MSDEKRLTVRDLLSPGSHMQNMAQYLKDNGVLTAQKMLDPRSVATRKRGASAEFKTWMKGGGMKSVVPSDQSAIMTIAKFLKESKQILDDFAVLQRRIDPQGETLKIWDRRAAAERKKYGRARAFTLRAIKLLKAAQ